MKNPDEWWANLAPCAREEIYKDLMGPATYYDIRLPLVRLDEKNLYDSQIPVGAPFRILGPASPLTWREATEKLAYYFHRELEYGFPPYTADEPNDWDLDKDRVLIFIQKTALADGEDYLVFLGSVGMRWRKWEDAPHGWALSWVWLHPYERRKGHFENAWPFLLEKFPGFRVEPPISEGMRAFLKKMKYEEQQQGSSPITPLPDHP